jgi:hypothetical protein
MLRSALLILTLVSSQVFAQTTPNILRITSAFTSFPDTARTKGHTYEKVLYSAAEHYSDSRVLIIVPPRFKAGRKVDIVCWFHGWRNNIDSAVTQFELIKQFLAAGRNAILILPETAKNSPDSYGGKLEQKNTFKKLLADVMKKLKRENIISKKTEYGNIVLAGHSGAFRIMAHLLQNAGAEISEVILFDGLYSQVDKYSTWIKADAARRFINIYTNKGGGTDKVSLEMIDLLREKNVDIISVEEKEVNAAMLRVNNVIFIHSLKQHNDVIHRPDHNFRLYLENSPVLRSLR